MIEIVLDAEEVEVGRFASGKVVLGAPEAASVSVAVSWSAYGEKTTIAAFTRPSANECAFHFKLPLDGPMTLDSPLFRVTWTVAAACGAASAERTFNVVPVATHTALETETQRPPSTLQRRVALVAAIASSGWLMAVDVALPHITLSESPPASRQAATLGGWLLSEKAAFQQQHETHAPVLIYFRTRRCGQCRHIEPILRSPEAARRLTSFIRLQVDPAQNLDFATKYGFTKNQVGFLIVKEDEEPRYVDFIYDETAFLNELDPPRRE